MMADKLLEGINCLEYYLLLGLESEVRNPPTNEF